VKKKHDIQINIEIDPGKVFQRELTALEQKKLPWAAQQAVNRTAAHIKQVWERKVEAVFERPVQLTRRAIIVKKARYLRNANGTRTPEPAVVYVRDEAVKGTPPAKYLLAQVYGGSRQPTGLEAGLRRIGILLGAEHAVPGAGAPTDGFGNVKRGVVKQILSQLHAQRDPTANQTAVSRKRRRTRNARRGERGGEYFAVRGSGRRGWTVNRDGSSRPSRLHPGIYQRFQTGFGSGVRSVYVFVRDARYRKRYTIFEYAQREWDRRFPGIFREELHTAVMESLNRGRR